MTAVSSERVPHVVLMMGPDGPAVLSTLFDVLARADCELGDMQVSRLAGRFSGVVVFNAPAAATPGALRDGFAPLRSMGVEVAVDPLAADERPLRHRPSTTPFVVSYSGANRPGLVRELSHALDDFGCEFVSMSADVVRGREDEAHVLVCEIDAPDGTTVADIQSICDDVADTYGVNLVVLPADMDELL